MLIKETHLGVVQALFGPSKILLTERNRLNKKPLFRKVTRTSRPQSRDRQTLNLKTETCMRTVFIIIIIVISSIASDPKRYSDSEISS